MNDPLSGEALAHLRHDLRTPINHILGYTEILLEDADESNLADAAPALREMNAGGRQLLDLIQGALADSGPNVAFAQLEALEGKLRPRAEQLLRASESLGASFRERSAAEAEADMERVSSALRRLLSLLGEMIGVPYAAASEPAAPHVPAAPAETTAPPAAPAVPAEGGGRVLVVEDNAANRDLLRRRLEREGHRVWEAANGVLALEMLAAGEYDLMLLDLMMPEMDGFEVLARLQQDERLRNLPVIMISALDEIQSVVRCIEMGAEDYLPKPFDPVLLRARIGASLEKKRLRDLERRKTEELEQALQRLKATQDQLVVQEKMASLGALTAGIAHEIKNPLNFVMNFAELSVDLLRDVEETLGEARKTMPPDDVSYLDGLMTDLTGNLQRIHEHGKRADSIVRGMLAHSRGGAGQREKVDLNALVAEAVNLAYHGLRAQNSAFNITLESDYDQSLEPMEVVPQDLSRVFLNITNNGCYAAHQKKLQSGDGFRPVLRVTTRGKGGDVEIRIRDNGTGMPKSVVQKIFNPFFTTKPTGSGTGLGLSLSYQIVVEQHKGTIRVDTQEGEYTEFIVTLPKQG
jgi:two-component system, NtrC family, sensor kinase